LHWGVDKEKFLAGNASPKWRNQSFAYLYNKLQLAQYEGQGIPTIIRTMREEGCPDPVFEIGTENVTCILPAHPRHRTIREIQEIQDKMILGKLEEAQSQILQLLETDLYNFRTLDLYLEIVGKQRESQNLFQFLIEKAVVNIKKLGDPEKVIQFINDAITKHPNLSSNSKLLEKRATSKMDLAKKCIEAARDKKSNLKTKAQAWDMCRQYLDEAEKDLNNALNYAEDSNEKFFIEENDIKFLEKMKEIAKKPNSRGDGLI
jgi:tetratricopeptide (TPR) repeat protein